MAEYIEREAVPSCNECIHNGVCGLQERCFDIELQLKEFGCDDFKPTADVVEVRHGRWSFGGVHNGKNFYKCSNCLHAYPFMAVRYCPNCGAKMDGKGEE